MIPFNIPPHTRCTNCGECCGPVLITYDEVAEIGKFMRENEFPREVAGRTHEPLECVFRDSVNKRCSIYPVRPLVCRLFGVAKGMSCPNGNSANIDFTQQTAIHTRAFAGIQNIIFGGNKK